MTAIIMFSIMVFLLLAGLPVAIMLGVVSTAWVMSAGSSIQMVASRMYAGIDMFVLMAIPFFCLAGEIMNRCGITDRLIKFVDFMIGRVRGGLAQANIYSSLLFAGITGAAVADVSALGSIFIPAMEKQGYTRKFSAMITAASSIIGPIIPPSIIVVVYGAVTGLSVGTLFAACMIPGVIVGLSMSAFVAIIARKRKFPKIEEPFEMKAFVVCFKDSILALIMPVIIIGGIFSGAFTPTEAAAVAVFYALLVGLVVYHTVTVRNVLQSARNAMRTSAMLFFIIGFANILGWIIARVQLPETIAKFMLTLSSNPTILLLLVLVLLLFVGTWLEITASCIILAPILSPVMVQVGVHPVHFAVVMVVALNVGLITPPLGVALFAAVGVGKVPFEDLVAELWPFFALDVLVLLLLVFIPELSLAVPRALGFIQ
ncbi:MAG: TRAP transporter large permease [Desulfarculaceae bacterium]|nr:TRAP transporter large permease [Desulfarculaceae bacterium]